MSKLTERMKSPKRSRTSISRMISGKAPRLTDISIWNGINIIQKIRGKIWKI